MWQQATRKLNISGIGVRLLKTSKPNHSATLGLARPYLLIFSKQSLTGNQVFRCLRLMEHLIQTTQLCENMSQITTTTKKERWSAPTSGLEVCIDTGTCVPSCVCGGQRTVLDVGP